MANWNQVLSFLRKNNASAGTFVSYKNENQYGYSSSSVIVEIGDDYLLVNFPNKDAFKKHELYLEKYKKCFLSIISINKSQSILLDDQQMIFNFKLMFGEFKGEALRVDIVNININNIPAQR